MSFFSFLSPTLLPQVRVYHSYGDEDRCMVLGHVLEEAPNWEVNRFKGGSFWRNAGAMLRLFQVRSQERTSLTIQFMDQQFSGTTDEQGFFSIDLPGFGQQVNAGWYPIQVTALSGKARAAVGEGKVYHPPQARQGFISDIDDTFLVSHSANILRKMRTLLTKTPETRRPFEGVVAHYQALALHNATAETPNPFFYVSSSEWNLYYYIKDFCRYHGLPEGVFLLSDLKALKDFVHTGAKNHQTKYDRIARILEEYPDTRFALLGDDTQEDPNIYHRIVVTHPGQINAVYVRKLNKDNREKARAHLQAIGQLGVPVSYFQHSEEALRHSREIGLA
ncbi:MAG: DUF2183 domain-containing protein [Sphingobacteriales bacterium]|nr:MAG: DUF2183 domain-containing protein [Sphingobacteriales bacterium]